MFDRIKQSIESFSSNTTVDEEAVDDLVEDIQRDLIRADVDVSLVSDLSDEIRQDALGEKKDGLSRKEHVLEVVYNRLEELLGGEANLEIEPQSILLSGLYGAGKTTTAGKLADFYRKRGMKVGMIAADTDRPAAHEQLRQLADEVDSAFYGEKETDNPVEIVRNGKQELDVDVTVVDTAGRNSLNPELKKELSEIESVLDPDQEYLVMPADIGQSARDQAQSFSQSIDLTGVIVTKMDSSAKGGGALIACENADIDVKFIGTGEKMNALEAYDPVEFVSDIIGQPDLQSLLDKIEELDTDPEEILEGEFTLRDFREQMSTVTDSGMMEDLMSQLPFSSDKIPDNVANLTEEKIGSYDVIIDSMTEEEINDPSIIDRSRKQRTADGSGVSVDEVQELLKHYRQTKNMVDRFDGKNMERGNMQNMMQKMGL